ncbi:unnamed protein product, partial [Onchocerca flexuosa]|uniref:Uncharacterized protein n=1 Tax=Onchocerca flexuosa TaxID=387005 RepID=A0A183HF14_9BILA
MSDEQKLPVDRAAKITDGSGFKKWLGLPRAAIWTRNFMKLTIEEDDEQESIALR